MAVAIGIAVRLGRRRGRRWLWALAPAMWLLVVADHAGGNAVVADQAAFVPGRSTVPPFLHLIWSWTGHGFNRGWLLLALLGVAVVADAQAQTGDPPFRAVRTSVRRSWAAATRAVATSHGPIRARAANSIAALSDERRRREASAPPFSPARPWLSTRVVAGITATLGVGLSVLLARLLALRIGPSMRPTAGTWFAGLLDALGDWWNGMGPGGQALVVGAGLGLIVLGGLLLLPEVVGVAGGLVVTEGGLIVVGAAEGAATAEGVAAILAGTGLLTMAAGGARIPRRGVPDKDGRPYESDAARREALSQDPSRGWRVTDDSAHEGDIGRALEDSGRLPKLWRDPSGGAEFIDEAGRDWDIKGFPSDTPGGFSLDDAMKAIRRAIGSNEDVILDTTRMSSDDVGALRTAIEQDPALASRILWWP